MSRLESLVASPCLWGKLQNLSFSKVSKQVVMSFCVAGVAFHDFQTCSVTCRKSFCVAGAMLLRRFQKTLGLQEAPFWKLKSGSSKMELLSSSILMFSSSFILELPALFGSFKMELLESLFCSCQKLQFAIDCYLVTHPKIRQPCLFAALRLSNMLVTSAKTKGRLSGGSTSSQPPIQNEGPPVHQ